MAQRLIGANTDLSVIQVLKLKCCGLKEEEPRLTGRLKNAISLTAMFKLDLKGGKDL